MDMPDAIRPVSVTERRGAICGEVLESHPEWFGIPGVDPVKPDTRRVGTGCTPAVNDSSAESGDARCWCCSPPSSYRREPPPQQHPGLPMVRCVVAALRHDPCVAPGAMALRQTGTVRTISAIKRHSEWLLTQIPVCIYSMKSIADDRRAPRRRASCM
jgi:hypothetical protein